MREYGKIHSSFWTSGTIRAMSDDGRTMSAYLLTSPHTNMLGCFRLPIAYVCDDLRWVAERVQQAFNELSKHEFATIDPATSWVVVLKYLKWNPFENPNVGKAAGKAFDQIPDNSNIKYLLADRLREYGKHFSNDLLVPFERHQATVSIPFKNGSGNRFETVSIGLETPFRNPEPNQSLNQNQNTPPIGGAPSQKKLTDATDLIFEEAWRTYPKREGGNPKATAVHAWEARVRKGEKPETLLAATQAYAKAMAVSNSVGTRFVLQAATFYGPDKRYAEFLVQAESNQGDPEHLWWRRAGFDKEWQATNAGCDEQYAHLWRDGKRIPDDVYLAECGR